MRLLGAIFVGAHGLGHVIWFMSTWAQWSLGRSGRSDLAKHSGGFIVPPLSAIGKVLGLLALISLIGFLAAAWGIWTYASWWAPLLIGSAMPSLVVLVAIWNPIGNVSVNALLANAALGAATLMPWGERFLGAH